MYYDMRYYTLLLYNQAKNLLRLTQRIVVLPLCLHTSVLSRREYRDKVATGSVAVVPLLLN